MVTESISGWLEAQKLWLGIRAALDHTASLAQMIELPERPDLERNAFDLNSAPDPVFVIERATGRKFNIGDAGDLNRAVEVISADRPQGPAFDFQQLETADEQYRPIPDFREWAALAVDAPTWDAAKSRLDQFRKAASPDDFRHSVEVAMRAAAIDTGAIEGLYTVDRGFTVSVALQTTAWQAGMQEHGENVREFFEAQLRAYELALDVATQHLPISEAWLRRLHEEICAPQQTIRAFTQQGWQSTAFLKGEYKRLPNHVLLPDRTMHPYAPVIDTPREMHRLVEQLNSADFEAAHPVLQAAYAHHAFVAIHPFQDGNGRVSRALTSVFLYRGTSVPLVIFADQKDSYFKTLAIADEGDRQPFVDFIFDRAIDTINEAADQLGAQAEHSLAEFRTLLAGAGGLSHTELDTIGYALLEALMQEMEPVIGAMAVPPGVRLNVQRQSGANPWKEPPPAYRDLLSKGQQCLMLYGQVEPPAHAQVVFLLNVVAARAADVRFPLRVQINGSPEILDVRLTDVFPEPTSAFKLRLAIWSRLIARHHLDALLTAARQALQKSGY
ncbi:MAG: Fic family protein [Dehalococcoidia bacterium]